MEMTERKGAVTRQELLFVTLASSASAPQGLDRFQSLADMPLHLQFVSHRVSTGVVKNALTTPTTRLCIRLFFRARRTQSFRSVRGCLLEDLCEVEKCQF